MPHFLDTLPFDWSQPAARELRDYLADTYFREELVIRLAQQAGVKVGSVAWGRPMSVVWHDLIEKSRNQSRLRPLLAQIANSADAAVAVRLGELTQDSPILEAPVSAPSPGEWLDFVPPDSTERLLFRDNSLLDVAFLRRGAELAPAVARLLVTLPSGQYYGTAFRISDDLLLTNHHVLFDERAGYAPPVKVEAWFGYEQDFWGRHLSHEVVLCRPQTVVGDKEHDWAVIKVASPMPEGTPVISLADSAGVKVGDRVYIIQHPNGGVKKIGMHHSIIRHIDDDVIQYWTDTEGGSSGSPVFDERWRLVGLHHRWVEINAKDGREYRNQGIRIGRVLDGLKAREVL
jgi:endonuclease G